MSGMAKRLLEYLRLEREMARYIYSDGQVRTLYSAPLEFRQQRDAVAQSFHRDYLLQPDGSETAARVRGMVARVFERARARARAAQ